VTTLLWVAAGSALGAPVRYLLDQLIQSRHERVFPWGTFVVNTSGSFLLGLLLGGMSGSTTDSWLFAAVGTGFLGSYTTFSTFTWESMRLIEDGAFLIGSLNIVAGILTGAAAAAAGLIVGSVW
jgi:fluoride exporter